jgi:hypothetical protein
MKRCSKCGESRSLDDFYWKDKSKGLKTSWCKTCKSNWSKERWASGSDKEANYESKARRVERAREYIWELFKNSKCDDCGLRDPMVFEFDHLGDKTMDISKMISSNYGLTAIQAEIRKCDIVCANCHKRRTSERGNHWRYARGNSTTR